MKSKASQIKLLIKYLLSFIVAIISLYFVIDVGVNIGYSIVKSYDNSNLSLLRWIFTFRLSNIWFVIISIIKLIIPLTVFLSSLSIMNDLKEKRQQTTK